VKNNLAAVVVLYNPEDTTYENICTYINEVDKLYLVDNSDIKNNKLIQRLLPYKNIIYIDNKNNLGIATALNIGYDFANKENYKWLLTMDQDSCFYNFEAYLNCIDNFSYQKDKTAIFTLNHSHIEQPTNNDCHYISKDIVITSGNILNLELFQIHNIRFEDDFFIDMVDYDLSYKVKELGYQIVLFDTHYLKHSLGAIFKRKNLISRKVKEKIEHNPQRVYYMTRNSLYLAKRYKDIGFIKTLNILFIHDITKIFLYEGQKIKKLKAKLVALFHFLIAKKGKYIL